MKRKQGLFILILLFSLPIPVPAQVKKQSLSVQVKADPSLSGTFKSNGRLFLFLNSYPDVEPRTQTWPSPGNHIFAKNFPNWKSGSSLTINNWKEWKHTVGWGPDSIPEGTYYLQALWDQDLETGGPDNPGNLYSPKQQVTIKKGLMVTLTLDKIMPEIHPDPHPLIREVDLISDTLSRWWKKPVHLRASLLLPPNYQQDSGKAFPIRYNVSGYGGRFSRVDWLTGNKNFMDWWNSPDAPRLITVYLDGYGPFGDCYQMDSENSGPFGYALIHELIPFIENRYRGTNSPDTRFVDGCSTGGWVSLALQVYYPDTFNGVFSYSPDAVEFENYQLINIYKDKNAYINEHGYLRPVWRDTDGEPFMSLKDFIDYENILGSSNSYLNSGGQFSAHTALYSPKGKNGLPVPLFDPVTGNIDSAVAVTWKKYDMKIYMRDNWSWLGPKLQGKIFIWMGDMDHFYLNLATRALDDWLKTTTNPVSDAQIIFSPREGHCQEFSDRAVLEKIRQKLDKSSR